MRLRQNVPFHNGETLASLGPSTFNVFVALVVVYSPTIDRLVRGSTLSRREQPYVESARAIGLRGHAIPRHYIFANAISSLIVQCTFVITCAIITEASLSFLDAGVPPETATWGNMLRDGQRVLEQSWWLAVFPRIALVVTLNRLDDRLRDALDPRRCERCAGSRPTSPRSSARSRGAASRRRSSAAASARCRRRRDAPRSSRARCRGW